ncbi:hypothetical protein GCM10009037_20620 [Halarchaeum grantii]|uniref:YdbS-like PH domain-containing protein n=1 Tax=Halarchaeum grantii TaxID=1193105 RepID=A0A830FB68_9EURY|nr:PH domain-containing protein [Halarchaeum grantii]GGL37014.1 hypothetical protein GCM10009037_20620 [Halarchaeum grantii]
MTGSGAAGREDVDAAVPLAADETVAWTARPRLTRVLPAVLVGCVLAVAGVAGWLIETPLALALVPVGVAVAAWRYLVNRHTQYVVSDDALYVKTGVLSRAVTQAALETVQNSAYTQSFTGSLFDYGNVGFELAGGGDLVFRGVPNPGEVRALVDRATQGDGIAGESGSRDAVPGTVEQWRAIREEVRRFRRALDD